MTQDTGKVILQESPKKHNPLTFYLRTLFYMLMALWLRLLCLAPLCALLCPAGSAWRWLALLAPALLIFFVLPMRFSFAQALVQRRRERFFSFDTALSTSRYGEKLAESLLHAVNVLKWGVPFLAMVAGMALYAARVDVLTLVQELTAFGVWLTRAWCDVANFFAHLFGNAAYNLTLSGGMMEGLYGVLAVLGVLGLIWLLGAARNSATRYIWVVADRADTNPRTEIRRRLRGRRLRQLGVALINLLLWAPALAGVYTALYRVLGDLPQLNILRVKEQLSSLDVLSAAGPLLFAFFALYLPLLPIRRYLTAIFATRAPRHTVPSREEKRERRAAQKAAQPLPTTPEVAAPAWKPAEAPVPAPTLNEGQPYDPQALNAPLAQPSDQGEHTVVFPPFDSSSGTSAQS